MKYLEYLILFVFSFYTSFADTITEVPEILEIKILSSVNNGIPDDKNKVVSNNDIVTLYLLISAKSSEITRYYLGRSNQNNLPESIKLNNKIVSLTTDNRWDEAHFGRLEVNWYYVWPSEKHEDFDYGNDPETPKYKWFTNNNPDKGNWLGKSGNFGKLPEGANSDIVEYSHLPIESQKNNLFFRSASNHDGTRFYFAELRYNNVKFYSAGERFIESVSNLLWDKKNGAKTSYLLGIKSNVHRVSRLSAHKSLLVSGIEAYKNIPWLYGSEGVTEKHQTERFVGFDCADLAVGGWRASGHKDIKYTYAGGLKSYTLLRGKWGKLRRLGNTIYRLDSGNPVKLELEENIKLGDILLIDHKNDGSTNHTAVIYKNNGPSYLDGSDWLIFAHHEGVVIATLTNSIPEEDSFGIYHFKDDGTKDVDEYNDTIFDENLIPEIGKYQGQPFLNKILSLPIDKNPFSRDSKLNNSPIYFRGAGFDLAPKTFTFDKSGNLFIPYVDIEGNIIISKYNLLSGQAEVFVDRENRSRNITHIVIDKEDNIIIAATKLFNFVEKYYIYKYNRNGDFLFKFGIYGEPFVNIDYLGLDEDGNIIVDNRIYSKDGLLIEDNYIIDVSKFPFFGLDTLLFDMTYKFSPSLNARISEFIRGTSFTVTQVLVNAMGEATIFSLDIDEQNNILGVNEVELMEVP